MNSNRSYLCLASAISAISTSESDSEVGSIIVMENLSFEYNDPVEKKKGEEFLHQMRMGKSFLHGVDRMGRPICVVRVRLHRASEQSVETLERFTVYTIETARLLLAPPVETAVSLPFPFHSL